MQTYTHAIIGAAIGAATFPHDPLAQTVCIVASVAPDLVMVPQYAYDVFIGRQPMTREAQWVSAAKEASHSLPLWGLIAGLALMTPLPWALLFLAAGIGGVGHLVIDIFTHGAGRRRRFHATDVTFMWPLMHDLRHLGVWEYRYDHGVLKPKPFELIVLLACAAYVAYRWFV